MKNGRSSVQLFDNFGTTGPAPINHPLPMPTLDSFITSIGHNLSGLGKYDTGGPFELYKRERRYEVVSLPPYQWNTGYWKGGDTTVDIKGLSSWPALGDVTDSFRNMTSELRAMGPRAINYSNPTKPESDILVAVLETAKDGIPHMIGSTLWRERSALAKSAGDEYLNVEFGWKPLVSDIKDFARVVMHSGEIVKHYERGSGHRQRRRFTFPNQKPVPDVNQTEWANPYPYGPDFGATDRTMSRTTSKEVWFEGAFRYYLAPSGIERYYQLAQHLYGVSLTPDVLWNLAPWTWAADWFGNVGDVMANISYLGPDASVMEWGYMMHGYVTTTLMTQDLVGLPVRGSEGHPFAAGKTFPTTLKEVVKQLIRVQASPYSFAVNPAPLSAKQTAIIVALGLSRKTA